ncbi:hypothetical protein LUZ60_009763 [Juncus effusus]|nr:hypothetical protein LUZ60_009763 [Juncus effusus]
MVSVGEMGEDTWQMKARIAAHPGYPRLLDAYIQCHKVGAPPEIVSDLEEIRQSQRGDNIRCMATSRGASNSAVYTVVGSDPELDQFMETYCDVLVKYNSELRRPFEEATSFLDSMASQLSHLCNTSVPPLPDEASRSTDEELSGGEEEGEGEDSHFRGDDKNLKEKLFRRYSGKLSSLKQVFSKKKKKGNLPKEARQKLLDWWTSNYKWPYPTETDKIELAESTGLGQKQINNWFINQRKRHWKPSENMQFAVMDNLTAATYFDS